MSDEWVSHCDWLARMFVNGSVQNPKTGKMEPRSGAWSKVFRNHPLVQRAEAEAWGRDLRMHVIGHARRMAMEGKQIKDHPADFFMPTDQRWIDYSSKQGLSYLDAKEWREKHMVAKEARAPADDSRDRKEWFKASEAVTRAAQAGFPDYVEGGHE